MFVPYVSRMKIWCKYISRRNIWCRYILAC